MKYDYINIFLDTNILLHYPPINNIDWNKLCDAKKVNLIICKQVIIELDEKKNHPTLSSRARRVIKEIKGFVKSNENVRDNVNLEIYKKVFRADDCPKSLNPDIKDEKIIYFVKHYIEEHKEQQVIIYSEDMNMFLSCETHSIKVIEPPDGIRLDDPTLDLDKELKKTRIELNKLKSKMPKIGVIISDSEEIDERDPFKVRLERDFRSIDIEAEINKEKLQITNDMKDLGLEKTDPNKLNVHPSFYTDIPKSEFDRYKKESAEYLEKLQNWLTHENKLNEAMTRCFEFKVHILNTGTSYADDIDITLRLPARFKFIRNNRQIIGDTIGSREKPISPSKPQSLMLKNFKNTMNTLTMHEHAFHSRNIIPTHSLHDALKIPNQPIRRINLSGTMSKGFNIEIYISRLKHHDYASIGTFQVMFKSWDDVSSFEIEKIVTEANTPDQIQDNIPIIVDIY